MEKNKSALPTPEQLVYGMEMREKGYAEGYQRCAWDLRKRKSNKEKHLRDRFSSYIDFLEDLFASHRKR